MPYSNLDDEELTPKPPKPAKKAAKPASKPAGKPAKPVSKPKSIQSDKNTQEMVMWMNKMVAKLEPLLDWKSGAGRPWQKSLLKLVEDAKTRGWVI